MTITAFCACSNDTESISDESTEPPFVEDIDAMSFSLSLGVGWNLGNSLDAQNNGVASETAWGNGKVTQTTLDAVRKAGFKSVRIPVTWLGHIGSAPDYKIEKSWMDRVAEIVGYAKNADLKVIINIHHDGSSDPNAWLNIKKASGDSKANEAIKQCLYKVWNQIAERFQNEGQWLIFETMNEIHDGGWGWGTNLTDGGKQYNILNEWNQVCVNAIRAAGGQNLNRFIGVPGYVANPNITINKMVLPTDIVADRLLVSVHCYDPWDYAGAAKYSEWGHTGKDVVPGTGETQITITLDALYNRYIKKGIPVYIGEFGCVHRSTERAEKYRKYYLEYFCKAMRDRNIIGFVWDNGSRGAGEEAFGLINHSNGEFIKYANNVGNSESVVRIMIDSWENNDVDYTLDYVYGKAPR